MGNNRKVTDKDFVEALKNSSSIAKAIKSIGLVPAGGNYQTAKALIKKYDIDVSHMNGRGWNVGDKMGLSKINTIPLDKILVENSTYKSTYHLKKRLFSSGVKEKSCECCGLTEWLGKEISLELHHENGERTDNRIENIKILCPNCHAMTDNYRGKNKSDLK